MSTELLGESPLAEGVPELTALGKRLEILRIERGVSKQRLARHAGTSRQQLWRVMTGKSELTSSLRERLAAALSVDAVLLSTQQSASETRGFAVPSSFAFVPSAPASAPTVTDFLTDPAHLTETLRTLPSGDGGRRLKRALLNAIDDLAVDAGRSLSVHFSDIRRRVIAGEL